MCPKIRNCICEIVGLNPEHIECAEKGKCFGRTYEYCKLYIAEYFANYQGPTIEYRKIAWT